MDKGQCYVSFKWNVLLSAEMNAFLKGAWTEIDIMYDSDKDMKHRKTDR